MSLKPKSLKSTLLWLLLPTLLVLMLASALVSFQELKRQINQAFDRTLAGALRSIEVNIRTDHGGLSMEQPFYLLEFWELATQSTFYFRITTDDNLTEIGFALPPPEEAQELTNKPLFYESQYLGEHIRIAAIAITPKQPLSYAPHTRLIIQVAENTQAREDFIAQMMWQSIGKDLLFVAISALMISLGVLLAIKPLQRLSRRIAQREVSDLHPIVDHTLPTEVKPLVDAINTHIHRYSEKNRIQQQFLDDASHQLRTPLAVLNTQISYAQSLVDKDGEIAEVLTAVQQKLTKTIELTNQLLTLAKVQYVGNESDEHFQPEYFNLGEVATQTVNELLPLARRKHMDYGLDIPSTPVWVHGIPWLIKEALSNFIINAIKYSPMHAQITISIIEKEDMIILQVEDNGPGMSPEDIALAGMRFRRGKAGKAQQGSGLGLAIVQTIADIHRIQWHLESPTEGGLKAQLLFPLEKPPEL